jgi:site-specific recombinase XerD
MAENGLRLISTGYVDENKLKNVGLKESFESLKKRFLNDARIRGVSPATIRSYDSHIRPFLQYLVEQNINLEDLTDRELKAFIGIQLEKNLSRVTINDYIRTFKHFCKWNTNEKIIPIDPSERIAKLREPKREKTVLVPKEIKRLLSVCPANTFEGIRNRAIISTMWDCGLRRTEVIRARIEDLDMKNKSIGVTGKGNKYATMPLCKKTIKILQSWIEVRGSNGSPYLFTTEDARRLNDSYFTHLIIKIGKKAGIEVNPHKIRHSVITWLAEQGMEPFDLQAFARHEDINTTMGYVQKSRLAKRLPEQHRRFSPGNKI